MYSVSRQYLINCSPKHDDYMTIYHFFVLEIRYKIFCLEHISLNLSCCKIRRRIFVYAILSSPTNSVNRRNKTHLIFEDKLWENFRLISMTLDLFVCIYIWPFQYYALFWKRNDVHVDWLAKNHLFIHNINPNKCELWINMQELWSKIHFDNSNHLTIDIYLQMLEMIWCNDGKWKKDFTFILRHIHYLSHQKLR